MSETSAISSALGYGSTGATTSTDSMGKEDFLKLLVAQLTHQDPTNPVQDTEFVSQLATYSGLEQQMNMNKNLETLISVNVANTVAAAAGTIGSIVGYFDADGQLQTGQVNFIDVENGGVYLILGDNTSVPFNQIAYLGPKIYEGDGGTGGSGSTDETDNNNSTDETDNNTDDTNDQVAEGGEGETDETSSG